MSKTQQGFSLIELVVVMSIFMAVLGVTVGIFISVVLQQKRILAEQELLTQAGYAIEYMSRGLRMATADPNGSCLGQTGYVYVLTHCSGTPQVCAGVKFVNHSDDNACQEFFLDSDGIFKEIRNDAPAQDLISDNFTINYAKFIIDGDGDESIATDADRTQPKITMVLDIKTQNSSIAQEKIIQSTVSQRNLAFPNQ